MEKIYHNFAGMDLDTSPEKFNPNYYSTAYNVTIGSNIGTIPDSPSNNNKGSLEGIKNITGKEVESAAWLAIESSAPYEVRIHEVSPIYREIGLMEFRRYMRELKICIDSKKFSQRGNIIEIGEPSVYFKQKYEFNEEMI